MSLFFIKEHSGRFVFYHKKVRRPGSRVARTLRDVPFAFFLGKIFSRGSEAVNRMIINNEPSLCSLKTFGTSL